jgi:retron-type reverse transcriptase
MSIPATTITRTTTSPSVLSEHLYREQLLVDLFAAYYAARANKRNTYSQQRFERDLSFNLMGLYDEIVTRRYRVGRSICFIIDRPVKREVFAASFKDRIVHHLLYRYLMPVFDPMFIYDSYSCRVGKGTLLGIERMEHHIRSCSHNYTRPCWVLKLDIQGYFMSIERQRLYDIVAATLSRKGLDKESAFPTMDFLLRQVIFNDPTKGCFVKGNSADWSALPRAKSLFYARPGFGLPIGNLTSQLFSNIYLNEFDQFVKRELKVRHYGRYVDDFYLVDTSRQRLLAVIGPIRDFLRSVLSLTLHPRKIYLQCPEKGVPFLGTVLFPSRRYLSSRAKRLMQERLAATFTYEPDPFRIRACVFSYKGYLSHLTHAPALAAAWGL